MRLVPTLWSEPKESMGSGSEATHREHHLFEDMVHNSKRQSSSRNRPAAVALPAEALSPNGVIFQDPTTSTTRILALAFFILTAVTRIAEGLGQEFPEGYLYFAIGLAVRRIPALVLRTQKARISRR
jgi:hypothetical protein